MDYNYNVISMLEEDAILITNGDNDTYPVWILTKLLNYRPDVKIVNRSLLNTEWYPEHLIKNEGVPKFITSTELINLRKDISNKIKVGKMAMPPMGPFSDTLITNLISSSYENQRPIYLASTLYQTEIIKKYLKDGLKLGLVTKIKTSSIKYSDQIKAIVDVWLNEFRTGGLESWGIKYGKDESKGEWLATNYAASIKVLLEPIAKYFPSKRLELFQWYKNYILDLLPDRKLDAINSEWCKFSDIEEIQSWCKANNYIK